jgi:hypothetical protein
MTPMDELAPSKVIISVEHEEREREREREL